MAIEVKKKLDTPNLQSILPTMKPFRQNNDYIVDMVTSN